MIHYSLPKSLDGGGGAGRRYFPVAAAAVARRRPDVRHPEGALLDLRHRHRLRHLKRLVEAQVLLLWIAQAAPPAAAGRRAAAATVPPAVLDGGDVEDVGVEGVGARDGDAAGTATASS